MDAERFDSLTRRVSDAQSRRTLLGGTLRGIVAGAAAAVSGVSLGRDALEAKKKAKGGKKKAKGGKKPKVTICHKGKTIEVANPAVPAHRRHGDTVGPCEVTPPSECTTPATCPVPPQLCAVATCVGNTCGSGPRTAGTVCRAAAGECDVGEVCTGTSLDCPANQFRPNNTPCTGGLCQNGACVAQCTTPATCPQPSQPCAVATCIGGVCGTGPRAAGTVCRAAAGDCDLAEVCNGTSLDCPANQFRPAGTVCRAASGVCDLAATCTGNSAACPANPFRPAGTVCRAASGPCDLAETCTGNSATCPGNVCRTFGASCPGFGFVCNGSCECCFLGLC